MTRPTRPSVPSRLAPVVLLAAVAATGGCSFDEKGNSCSILDLYVDGDGDETYCPDDEAPAACEDLVDEMLATAGTCADRAGLPFDEDAAREGIANRGIDCDAAVATTTGYDACMDELTDDEPPCDDDGTMAELSECDGVVLTAAR